MILTFGQVEKLAGKSWAIVELRSEKTVENTMRRLIKSVPQIFKGEAVEFFLPILRRDLDLFEMSTGVYLFARSTSFNGLLRLKSVTGVVSLVTEGESNRPSNVIWTPDDYVQQVISQTEDLFHRRAEEIAVGSFVRILDGETRDYCGTVMVLQDGYAVVRIALKTKFMLIETPVRNLLNLNHIPKNQRVFYYCALVDELADAKLVAEDLEWAAETKKILAPIPLRGERFTHQRTVTAVVRRMISEGVTDPMAIAKEVVTGIRAHDIRTPKNLPIISCIIKHHLRDYFRQQDSKLRDYRTIIRRFGQQYRFTVQDIADLDPTLGVPLRRPDLCNDGRSREARQQRHETRKQDSVRKAARRLRRKERRQERRLARLAVSQEV